MGSCQADRVCSLRPPGLDLRPQHTAEVGLACEPSRQPGRCSLDQRAPAQHTAKTACLYIMPRAAALDCYAGPGRRLPACQTSSCLTRCPTCCTSMLTWTAPGACLACPSSRLPAQPQRHQHAYQGQHYTPPSCCRTLQAAPGAHLCQRWRRQTGVGSPSRRECWLCCRSRVAGLRMRWRCAVCQHLAETHRPERIFPAQCWSK